MQPDSLKITELLRAWGGGDVQALDELTRLVHDYLHRFGPPLVDSSRVVWQNCAHFFALAAH